MFCAPWWPLFGKPPAWGSQGILHSLNDPSNSCVCCSVLCFSRATTSGWIWRPDGSLRFQSEPLSNFRTQVRSRWRTTRERWVLKRCTDTENERDVLCAIEAPTYCIIHVELRQWDGQSHRRPQLTSLHEELILKDPEDPVEEVRKKLRWTEKPHSFCHLWWKANGKVWRHMVTYNYKDK